MYKWYEVDTFEKFEKIALTKTRNDFNFRVSKPVIVVKYYSPGTEIQNTSPDKELNLLLFYITDRNCYFFKERDSEDGFKKIEAKEIKLRGVCYN